MPKNTGNIDRSRLQRFFVGTHTLDAPQPELWYEMGHFIQGFDFKTKRVSEKNGILRERTYGLGFTIEGSCEPAQNKISDYTFYNQKMNETRNVAMLCNDDELILFRLVRGITGFYDDNRISMLTSGGYGSLMQKAYTEFSGWIKYYEKMKVKDFSLSGTSLKFTIVESMNALDVPFIAVP